MDEIELTAMHTIEIPPRDIENIIGGGRFEYCVNDKRIVFTHTGEPWNEAYDEYGIDERVSLLHSERYKWKELLDGERGVLDWGDVQVVKGEHATEEDLEYTIDAEAVFDIFVNADGATRKLAEELLHEEGYHIDSGEVVAEDGGYILVEK